MYAIYVNPNVSINNVTSPSQITPITLSSISSELDNIKEIVNNTYTNANTNNKSFADTLKQYIEPKLSIITNIINKIDNNNTKYLYNKLPCTNEHIDVKKLNNEYIKSLFVLLDLNLTSITNVFFRNNNAYIYIYFTNSFSKLKFLNCARLFR